MRAKTFTPRTFIHASVLLFFCSNFANIFQFLFQSLMRRSLTVGDFSLMNSLFSSIAFVSLPIAIWTQIWNRKFAELRARGHLGLAIHYVQRVTLYSLIYGVLVCVILFYQMDGLKKFLNTENTSAVMAFLFGLMMALALPMGGVLLQGTQAFGVLALVALVGPAFRLVLGYLFVKMGWGAAAGVWATALQGLVPLGAAVWFYLHYRFHAHPVESDKGHRHWKLTDFWVPGISVIIGTILVSADFVLVQHFFPPEEADRFATAAIFGHSMIFFLMPISSVLLPKVVDHFEGWEKAEKAVVRKALYLGLILALVMAGFGTFLADFVLQIFTGKNDPQTLSLVRWFLWAIIPTALTCICLNALLARLQGKLMLLCLFFSLLFPAIIIWKHEVLNQILIAHFVVGALLLTAIILGNLKRLKI